MVIYFELSCLRQEMSSIPGLRRSPGEGNGNPLQYSCLGNPMDRGTWRATVHGVPRVRRDSLMKSPLPHTQTHTEGSCLMGTPTDTAAHQVWPLQSQDDENRSAAPALLRMKSALAVTVPSRPAGLNRADLRGLTVLSLTRGLVFG